MRLAKLITILMCVLASCVIAAAQEIRDQKEAERLYFDEADKCTRLRAEQKFREAELSCRRSIQLAAHLPSDRYLELSSGYVGVGIAQMRLSREPEAISNFLKALEIARPIIDDDDAETGDIFFLLGQAHHMKGDLAEARSYYQKAEATYRAAFIAIDDDWLRSHYPRTLRLIVEAHYILLENAELKTEAAGMKSRLEKIDKDFAKYLKS